VPHPFEHSPADRPLGRAEAGRLAETFRAFGAASRVLLLFRLLRGASTVEELAADAGLQPNAVSQQLRVLRQPRFVIAERRGRHVLYRLHDDHVAALLAAVRHHHEHIERAPAMLEVPEQELSAR